MPKKPGVSPAGILVGAGRTNLEGNQRAFERLVAVGVALRDLDPDERLANQGPGPGQIGSTRGFGLGAESREAVQLQRLTSLAAHVCRRPTPSLLF